MSFTGWLNPKGSKQKKATGMDLIEKFIQENPTISKAKADTYTAPNIAKMSVVDNDDLVTETLARVYMKQGHYDKAITTYEKLSLKIPEKKAFFASQIEVIEELKKQK
jgi:tetratricopeptide (TPR) repeat protein